MHPLTLLTAASALITSALAVDLTPMMDWPGKPGREVNPKPKDDQVEKAVPSGWNKPDCEAPYPGLKDGFTSLTDIWKDMRGEAALGSPFTGLPAGKPKCKQMMIEHIGDYRQDLALCNDSEEPIRLTVGDVDTAVNLIIDHCGEKLTKAVQVFNKDKNWNLIFLGAKVNPVRFAA